MFRKLKFIQCILFFLFLFSGGGSELFCLPVIPASASGHIIARGDKNIPPHEFLDETGKPSGFNADITRAVAKATGLKVKLDYGAWDQVRKQLENGEIDLLTGMFYSKERARLVDFSRPHLIATYAVFVRNGSEIKNFSEIKGHYVLVEKGDFADDYLTGQKIYNNIVRVESPGRALRLLAAGQYDCAVLPRLIGVYFIDHNGLDNLCTVGEPILPRKYCFAVKKGDTKLLASLNEGLSIINNTGEYERIYQKWFGEVERKDKAKAVLKTAFWILTPVFILLILALLWTRSLKHQVFSKTRELVNELGERKKAEESLKESEEKYRLLVNNAAEAIFILQEGKICFANPTFIRLLGVSESELPNMSFSDFASHDKKDLDSEFFPEQLEGEEVQSEYRLELTSKKGQSVWLDLNLAPVTWQDKPATLCMARDITEQKSMEAQLRHSQKMEAIGTLAGGIAHDFNNILGGILGYAELGLLRESQHESNQKELEGVITATKKASRLVQQILTFSRHMSSDLKPLSVNEQVLHSVALLERTIPKMISIELDLAPDIKPVKGDENQLEQMLLNLGGNAKDAMPDGGVLGISTYNKYFSEDHSSLGLSAGDYAVIKVSDTGQGIQPEIMSKIFDPFFTTKEVGKGTGLGLSSVFGVVKGHGGQITCSSQVGKGTVFEIFLPTTKAIIKRQGSDSVFSFSEKESSGATILLVDDEEPLRQVGSQVLTARGFKALTAESGERALEIYKKRFDEIALVVLDVGMPGMGGHQCLAELLAFDPKVKVIIASGYAMRGKGKDTLALGARGYLGKPYGQNELLRKIKEILKET